MNYCWTTLQVKDIDESIAFYQNIIKLPLNRRFEVEGNGKIAFLGSGETMIELIQNNNQPCVVGNAITLGFAVDSIDETISFIKEKGIKIESGPFTPNDHITFFYVLDPNGIKIQFSQSF
ncbi:MAG: VOC family protein [Spirochaetia bacterium]|nr:VOC family protein [Spirochaetia bacterium]